MFILDTNVISELRHPNKAHPNILAWANDTPVAQTFLSAITILEIELGTLRVERKDKVQGKILRDWIETLILPRFEGRILAVDTAVARCCAALQVPDPCAERDALVAATAVAHAMTVVTRNVADFVMRGVSVINPWD